MPKTILDFPLVSTALPTDECYIVRGTGPDRDKRLPLGDIMSQSIVVQASSGIPVVDLGSYAGDLSITLLLSGTAMEVTLTGKLVDGKRLCIRCLGNTTLVGRSGASWSLQFQESLFMWWVPGDPAPKWTAAPNMNNVGGLAVRDLAITAQGGAGSVPALLGPTGDVVRGSANQLSDRRVSAEVSWGGAVSWRKIGSLSASTHFRARVELVAEGAGVSTLEVAVSDSSATLELVATNPSAGDYQTWKWVDGALWVRYPVVTSAVHAEVSLFPTSRSSTPGSWAFDMTTSQVGEPTGTIQASVTVSGIRGSAVSGPLFATALADEPEADYATNHNIAYSASYGQFQRSSRARYEVALTLTSNFNNATAPGQYSATTGATNSPNSTLLWTLDVQQLVGTPLLAQTACSPETGDTWRRWRTSTSPVTWTAWTRITTKQSINWYVVETQADFLAAIASAGAEKCVWVATPIDVTTTPTFLDYVRVYGCRVTFSAAVANFNSAGSGLLVVDWFCDHLCVNNTSALNVGSHIHRVRKLCFAQAIPVTGTLQYETLHAASAGVPTASQVYWDNTNAGRMRYGTGAVSTTEPTTLAQWEAQIGRVFRIQSTSDVDLSVPEVTAGSLFQSGDWVDIVISTTTGSTPGAVTLNIPSGSTVNGLGAGPGGYWRLNDFNSGEGRFASARLVYHGSQTWSLLRQGKPAGGGGSGVKAFTLTFGRWFNGWLGQATQFPPGDGWSGGNDDGTLAPGVAAGAPINCTLKAVTFKAASFGATAVLNVNINGTLSSVGSVSSASHNFTGLNISVSAGDSIWFEVATPSSAGNAKGVNITAYFEA